MYLRRKIFSYILLTVISLAFLMAISSNYTTMKAFSSAEYNFLEQDMRRLQTHLDNDWGFILKYSADCGHWDSVYFFMDQKDPSGFEELLEPKGLRELNFDILVVTDTSLLPVVSYFITDTAEKENLSPEDLEDFRRSTPRLMERARESTFQTVLSLGSKNFLAGVSPIRMTDRTGEPKGFLLLGKSVEREAKEISAIFGIDSQINLFPENGVPFRSSRSVRIRQISEGLARVQQVRESPQRTDPPLTVSFMAPRAMYELGRNAVATSYMWIFLSGAGVLAVVMLALDLLILRRLKSLRCVSERIVAEGGIQLRVPASGRDEISTLSSSFNMMLDTLENLISDIPDSLFISDLSGKILLANKAASTALCIDDGCRLSGSEISSVLKVRDAGKAEEVAGSSLENRVGLIYDNRNVFEAEFIRSDGSTFPVEVHRREIVFGKRPLVLFLSRDMTERKTFETRLARKAYLDDLTGLPNRYAFIEDLNRALSDNDTSGTSFFAALLNLDRFKLINARVGNFNGDRILLILAKRLAEFSKEGSRIYRIGGDEFALLVPSSTPQTIREEAESLMEHIQRAIRLPCQVGDELIFPSASIGVLKNIHRCRSSSDIISRLMQTVNDAKKAGMGFILFSSVKKKPESALSNILQMSAEIRSALERDEFFPCFQPIYSLPERKIAGVETLARWNHPVRGLLLPGDFITTAEHIGLVPRIDSLMMMHAMESIQRLHSFNISSISFSVNSSPLFFKTPQAADIIEGMLKQSGADPSLFILEVTESLLIENLEEVSRMLFRLKNYGIKIALDDFGTGYSSLRYLNELPFDFVKLDRSFVSKLLTSEKDRRLLKTIINMAHDLNLEVIAEGVEKEAELLWLEEAGCNKIQGYFFSKPVPWARLQEMVEKENQERTPSESASNEPSARTGEFYTKNSGM